ncbi:MAG TPA: DUF2892 domain-containing protein [Candidatus Krumholzibacteria bacterium]|nr:DUF2892 domain-containing protein [Candidatus Krumholzibacteria bacterium]
MNCNVGGIDRGLRIVVGIAALAAGVAFSSWWGALGAIPLVTGLVGRCPVYLPFRASTCAPRQTNQAGGGPGRAGSS